MTPRPIAYHSHSTMETVAHRNPDATHRCRKVVTRYSRDHESWTRYFTLDRHATADWWKEQRSLRGFWDFVCHAAPIAPEGSGFGMWQDVPYLVKVTPRTIVIAQRGGYDY